MSTKKITWIAAVCQVLSVVAYAAASPVITIDEDSWGLPDEAFFAANPTAVVNVHDFGSVAPHGFNFSGATLNINDRGELGFPTIHPHLDNVNLNLNTGGVAFAPVTFTGATGATTVNVNDGWARGLLRVQGDAVMNVHGGRTGGGQAHGAPSIIAEGNSQVTITGGIVEDNVAVAESGNLTIAGGTVGDFLTVEDSAHLTVSGGSLGQFTHVKSSTATVDIRGGTIDREFMATDNSTISMTGGAIGGNSLLRDSVMNMSGGALGAGFKIYNSTLSMSGGTFGDNLKLGGFTGSPGTLNLFVDSVTINGDPLELGIGETMEVTRRDDAFLAAELVNGGSVGIVLNSDYTTTIDFLSATSTLNLIRPADASDFDLDGDIDADDLADWMSNYGTTRHGSDFLSWQRAYTPGTIGPIASITAVPEPATVQIVLAMLATIAGRRSRRTKVSA